MSPKVNGRTEERIHELEDGTIESTHSQQQRIRLDKTNKALDTRGTIVERSKVCTMGISGNKEGGLKKYLKK